MHESSRLSRTFDLKREIGEPEVTLLAQLHEFGARAVEHGNPFALLDTALDIAIRLTDAFAGCAYSIDFDGNRLRMVAQRGLFEHGLASAGPPAAVEAAAARRQRVLEDQVALTTRFGDRQPMSVCEDVPAACQSTPIVARSGEILGVVSTYFPVRRWPDDRQLQQVDHVVRHAADFLHSLRTRRMLERRLAIEHEARMKSDSMNQRKDRFFATLSHELRQPLAAALTAVELQRHQLSAERQSRVTTVLEQQLRQLSRLIEDMADLSRISRGILTLDRTPTDLRSVVQAACDMTTGLFEACDHKRTIVLGDEPAWVSVDPERMVQVFSNLLRNAASYTPNGGRISVAISQDASWIEVEVQDNGIGISEDALERIFQMFERGDNQPQSLNRGIGLAVVRQIVELHEGTVKARSGGAGKGSEFVICLPRQPAPSPSA